MNDYDYDLPQELIAASPADPRDSSRLFIYDTSKDEVAYDIFKNISKYLPENSLLVLNDTKVVPARLELTKQTGGKVRILFLVNEWDGSELIKGLPDRKVNVGEVLCHSRESGNLELITEKMDSRLRGNDTVVAKVVSQRNEEFTFKLLIDPSNFDKILFRNGTTPLPPYIHTTLTESEARSKYQTVFAEKPASVAAPTASLHFTDRVFDSLKKKGIETAHVTLHVGRGTFSPVTDEVAKEGKLHAEPVEVSKTAAELIKSAHDLKKSVIAAGTTATRALESAADKLLQGEAFKGDTSLMISPGFDFKIVDGLITNFHLPKTSLLMLLDAFITYKGGKKGWRELYEMAIKEKFRFYSFGDAMLII